VLPVSIAGFGLASFALKLDSPSSAFSPGESGSSELAHEAGDAALPLPVLSRDRPRSLALELPWDTFAVTSRGERARTGGLDGRGHAIPRELLALSLRRAGVDLDLAHAHRRGEPSALLCRGQRIALPSGFRRLLLLIAAFPEAASVEFSLDDVAVPRRIASGFAPLGRFDELERGLFGRPSGEVVRGYLHAEPLALAIPHRHDRRGRIDPCAAVAFFSIGLDLPTEGAELRLPQAVEARIVVLAATVSEGLSPAAVSLVPPEFR
jgi:hypothetical protein